ncbi:glycosyltransferase [Gymnodinialimonas sp. 2305UL16-5]|uniref:glycosyltransferase family 2 protein n=1 Tax=Gymnodinialimonas mytili TaxID=3126503 RepID=UPI0030A27213
MAPDELSVIVVSWGRPDALRRCLLSLSQQCRSGCEVIVVADPAGLASARSLPFADRLKLVDQDGPNVSRARNAGLSQAAGQVVAFIDDDAIAEPTWVAAICAAFDNPGIAALTGPVLGRNGTSLQWGPLAVNACAQDTPMEADGRVPDGYVRKLQGTNMAFRRAVFEDLGGFDEGFAFYLDDTDIALRLGRAGLQSMWVPNAVVHHSFAASARRTGQRVPLSLEDIGASTALFLRKHAPVEDHARVIRDLEAAQSTRLLQLARTRKLNDSAMRGLMESLRDGLAAGAASENFTPPVKEALCGFLRLVSGDPPGHRVLSGWSIKASGLRKRAADLVADGFGVTLLLFDLTPRKHKVFYTDTGWWEQMGGLYGAANRDGPRLRFSTFKSRRCEEIRRISDIRGL